MKKILFSLLLLLLLIPTTTIAARETRINRAKATFNVEISNESSDENNVSEDINNSEENSQSSDEILVQIDAIKQEISRLQAKQAELESLLISDEEASTTGAPTVEIDGGLFEFENFRIIDNILYFDLTYHNQSDTPNNAFSAFILNMSYYQDENGTDHTLLINGYPDPNSSYKHLSAANPAINPGESVTVTAAFTLNNDYPVVFSNIFSPQDNSITIDLNTLSISE